MEQAAEEIEDKALKGIVDSLSVFGRTFVDLVCSTIINASSRITIGLHQRLSSVLIQ
jgi:hypothetical protein